MLLCFASSTCPRACVLTLVLVLVQVVLRLDLLAYCHVQYWQLIVQRPQDVTARRAGRYVRDARTLVDNRLSLPLPRPPSSSSTGWSEERSEGHTTFLCLVDLQTPSLRCLPLFFFGALFPRLRTSERPVASSLPEPRSPCALPPALTYITRTSSVLPCLACLAQISMIIIRPSVLSCCATLPPPLLLPLLHVPTVTCMAVVSVP